MVEQAWAWFGVLNQFCISIQNQNNIVSSENAVIIFTLIIRIGIIFNVYNQLIII